jgi:uncharacterized delta-60 repeat protein
MVILILLGVGRNESQATDFDRPSQEAALAEATTAAYGIALQPDNKLIAAGTALNQFALARFNPDGSLDLNFDEDGKVTTSIGANAAGAGVVIQSDNKIVVAGTAGSDFALARYNSDGSLDSDFGADGIVTTTFGVIAAGSGLVIQPDGKLVLAGTAGDDFAVARYNLDGSLDPGFDFDGVVTTGFGTAADAAGAVLQPDGKIVLAGTVGESYYENCFALTRYNLDGSLDAAFGGGGKVIAGYIGDYSYANAVTMQSDNKIIVAGFQGVYFGATFTLLRFNPDGSLDTTFGEEGIVHTDLAGEYDYAYAVTMQPDNIIIAAGGAGIFCQCDFPYTDFGMARYHPDGSLYSVVTTDISGINDWVYALLVQPDGKIVLAGGGLHVWGGTPREFAVARYTPSGNLDTSFSNDGIVTTDFLTRIRFYLPVIQKRTGSMR